MGILLNDKKIDILMAFINLERNDYFKDQRNREFILVSDTLAGIVNYHPIIVSNELRYLIKVGLITKEIYDSQKCKNLKVSLLFFRKENKAKLKQLFEEEPLFKYIGSEFYAFIIE